MWFVAGQNYVAHPRYRTAQGQLYIPDFVVNLPNDTHIVLDSKTSLVDYDRALQADASDERTEALNDLVDRKSTRLNSSHVAISYAVFCLKKNNNNNHK